MNAQLSGQSAQLSEQSAQIKAMAMAMLQNGVGIETIARTISGSVDDVKAMLNA